MSIKSASLILAIATAAGSATAAEMSEPVWGLHYVGGDYKAFTTPVVNYQACEFQCAVEAQCVSWAYNAGAAACWLKSSAPETSLIMDPSVVSGVKVQSGTGSTGGTGGTATGTVAQ